MDSHQLRSRCLALSVATLLALAVLSPAGAGAAQQRAQFGTRVEVLQIQVRVTDNDGNFVSGLGASDFAIKVNGKSRNITTAYEVDLNDDVPMRSAIADAAPPPPAAWRQFLLFFDAGFNSPRGVRAAQEAAVSFIDNQVRPDDLVAVATYNVVAGTHLLVPFTTDRRQVMEALGGLGLRQAPGKIDRAGFMAQTMTDAYAFDADNAPSTGATFAADAVADAITQIARLDNAQYASVAAEYSEQLGTLGEILQSVRGTKHVVMFSRGFADEVISGASLDQMAAMSNNLNTNAGMAIATAGDGNFGSADVRSALDNSLKVLRGADAVIHVVDTSGVGGERDSGLASGGRGGGTFSSTGDTRSALSMLADGTDGTLDWNTNEPSAALAEIEESTRQFYVLAFPQQKGDKGVLDLDVSVSRPGVKLVSAPRNLAPAPEYTKMNDMQKQAQLAEFISKGIVESDMQFEMAAAPFFGKGNTSRVGVVVEVPWGQLEELAKARGDGKVTFDIFGYVIDENGTVNDLSNNQVNLDIKSMSKGRTKGLPFRFYDLLWATPGNNQVRALIREAKIGRISAVTQQVVAPRYSGGGKFTVSGPVAMDEEHNGLIMRGLDPANPPENKVNGPVDYPYVFKGIEWTPATHAEATPGDTQQLYVAVYNMSRHPLTGQAQPPTISLHLLDAAGQEHQLADIQLIDQAPDPSGGIQMVLGAVLPKNLDEGYYILRFKAEDAISSTSIEHDAELFVKR